MRESVPRDGEASSWGLWPGVQVDFPGALVEKNPPTNAGTVRDLGSISGLGRPPGGGHGNPPQYSCLENLIATGHRVAELDTTEIPWHYAQMMKEYVWAKVTLLLATENRYITR